MSSESSGTPTMKDRVKRIAIPVLICAFAAVILRPLLAAKSTPTEIDTGRSKQRIHALTDSDKPSEPSIPRYDLDSLLAFDPFRPLSNSKEGIAASSDSSEQSDSTDESSEGSEIAETSAGSSVSLKAVYEDSSGKTAIIGSRIVRVGDVLDNGYRVQLITRDGVVLGKE
jgi:hypothetical protein